MAVQNYPLSWPQGFPRQKYRESGRDRSSWNIARKTVEKSLELFAKDSCKVIANLVISSNVTVGGGVSPNDPAVAVWFMWDGMQVCIPIDRYRFAESNLQAIHHVIEARRVELRHGTLALIRATFTGFRARPAPAGKPRPAPAGKHWRDILALPSDQVGTREQIERAFKTLATVRHPDRGGSTEAMAELNIARQTAL